MKEQLSIDRAGEGSSSIRSNSADRRNLRIEKRIPTSQYTKIPAFQYSALKDPKKDLRLVTISPSPDDEAPLVLSMKTHSKPTTSNGDPQYFALSYTWGDAAVTVPVLLNGKILHITRNLEIALKRIRNLKAQVGYLSYLQPKMYSLLWIDAICINQGDAGERDEQVQRMQDIYRDAVNVLVWLGDFDEPQDVGLNIRMDNWGLPGPQPCSFEEARTVLELVIYLCVTRLRAYADREDDLLELLNVKTVRLTVETIQDRRLWSQLSRLFNRTWFQRLWVIQELGLAKEAIAIWGYLSIDWQHLTDAAISILRPGKVKIPPHIREILPLIGAHRVTQVALDAMVNFDKNNILTALHNTQRAQCTDPRDRLYAILGIVDDVKDVEIDYSIPVEEVYRRWAMKRIQRTQSLDILSACVDSRRSGNLPSWVPELRLPIGQDKVLWLLCHGGDLSSTQQLGTTLTHLRPFLPKFSADGMRLSVAGFKIDTVLSVGVAADLTSDGIAGVSIKLIQTVETWEQWLSQQHFPFNENLMATISRSLKDNSSRYDDDGWRYEYNEWRRYHRLEGNSRHSASVIDRRIALEDKPGHLKSSVKDFERWVFPRVHGCQIFGIKNFKVLGIVAAQCGVNENDELFLLEGALTPMVLRREVNAHRIMGPCYLWGWMDREVNRRLVLERLVEVKLM